jgi:hypothetical protein
MKYYKQNNIVYSYDEEQVAQGLADDKTELTAEEIELHLNPPKTQEQLQAEASVLRDEQMLEGVLCPLNDLVISLTKEDGDGLLQVKAGFELGLINTVIHFKNGTKLPITAEEFPAFALWFVQERNKFFTEVI